VILTSVQVHLLVGFHSIVKLVDLPLQIWGSSGPPFKTEEIPEGES
jgi:hypothetical protein